MLFAHVSIIIASGELLFDGTPTELIAKSDRGDIEHAFRLITTSSADENRETAAP